MEVSINQEEQPANTDTISDALSFYVVSPKKLIILYMGTLGLYGIYWFYKNWSNYKTDTNEKIWPVMRGLFSIFFAHRLFQKITKKLGNNDLEASKSADTLATIYVLVYIVSGVCDRLSGNEIGTPYSDYVSIILLPLICWVLHKMQLVANIACDDPMGESNSQLTPLNYLWLVLGALIWGLIIWSLTL